MSTSRFAPARLLTSVSIVLALVATISLTSTIGPTTRSASAVVTAARAHHALAWAKTRKGSPYRYGADGPHRFDCSGLTRWAYARVGKWLPHSSSRQAHRVHKVYHRRNARRGDLVFFYGHGGIYHVAVYAGHGYVWHAPHSGTRVRRNHIWTRHVFFGRVR